MEFRGKLKLFNVGFGFKRGATLRNFDVNFYVCSRFETTAVASSDKSIKSFSARASIWCGKRSVNTSIDLYNVNPTAITRFTDKSPDTSSKHWTHFTPGNIYQLEWVSINRGDHLKPKLTNQISLSGFVYASGWWVISAEETFPEWFT
jgi:hypothetical protein